MSNYNATARSNYFRVKDLNAFREELDTYGIKHGVWEDVQTGADFVVDSGSNNKPEGSIALFSYGPWPMLDEDSVAGRLGIEDDETEIPSEYETLHDLVAKHLVEGEIAIFQEIGFEKMIYLGGRAVAVNHLGETRIIDLDDIYEVAKELAPTGATITRAQY